jgi:hypothetical protein
MDCGACLACEADLELKAKATADKPLPNLAMRSDGVLEDWSAVGEECQ